ncbi:hypothetical protein CEXT_121251 [Caerostris extrusa]|uniref:Secreted protein n=1 Tax=Caerostris extrusa TaxID=172846 RepID=A0AAV4Q0T3_CAEEX|nr:hypothetical protein CEXT_121251 [Caerostris extrusa]
MVFMLSTALANLYSIERLFANLAAAALRLKVYHLIHYNSTKEKNNNCILQPHDICAPGMARKYTAGKVNLHVIGLLCKARRPTTQNDTDCCGTRECLVNYDDWARKL